MMVVKSGETGAEEWNCPSCGRRLLLRWPPRFERIVLHPGDDRVIHVGPNCPWATCPSRNCAG
ncbi:hypothetical protein [Paractinoplanes hotanensis]|uniref:Uncharacterized protein n=1 Tax=Paractinoplanes hotanensis TaxID=2906497 RepID=A0ABT0XYK0_9ACTN|nr:hypothetical protein [Actinoplanes hotanensis]MCM4078851.1 hypothetical protein [Actinoplanes hotanensis]